jgi:hypothetical protein
MALKRMDNVGIVVEDLERTIDFLRELGLELEGGPRSKENGRDVSPAWPVSLSRLLGCVRRMATVVSSSPASSHRLPSQITAPLR